MSLTETIAKLRQRADRLGNDHREIVCKAREKHAALEELLDTIAFLETEERKRLAPQGAGK